jgi:hypothetical protein
MRVRVRGQKKSPGEFRGFFTLKYVRQNKLENQLQLLPFLPFYLGTGVIPGALGHYRGCVLFAFAAAGKAELVGVFVTFH